MQPFTTLTGVAAPLPLINIDTDMIIPKQFLKTIKRSGLGANLFDEMRFNPDGSIVADFVLNKPEYKAAKVLVAGDNFGCGSSREHAPWALLDYGIRCVITPSFADIFFNNCFKNGILPIVLPEEQVAEITEGISSQPGAEITVDLESQQIRCLNKSYRFDVEPFRKECLLGGLDDIALSLKQLTKIDAFEDGQKQQLSWLYQAA